MDPKAKRSRLLEMAAAVSPGGPGRSKTLTREQQLAALIDKSMLAAERALSAAMSKGDPAGISAAVAVVERVHGLCAAKSGSAEPVEIVIYDEAKPVVEDVQVGVLVAAGSGPGLGTSGS